MSGSVTDPTGSVKGNSTAGLLDAYVGNFGGSAATIPPQWQHAVLLSSVAGACAREGSGGSYAPNELTLRLTMIGYRASPGGVLPPVYPPAPVTFTANSWQTTSDGVNRVCQPYVMRARSNGGPGGDVAATSGAVVFGQMDAAGYAGSYDLWFGSDHITGAFFAPWCGTAP